MGRYAIVKKDTGVVENVVLWDGKSQWSPPAGCIAVVADEAVGPKFIMQEDGTFKRPPDPEPVEPKKTLEQLVTELTVKVDGLAKDVSDLKSHQVASCQAKP